MHSRLSFRSRNPGFTLIELLTVIAIIGILAAILIPTVGLVREKAKRARCTSNVRQISALLIGWANQDKNQRFPNIQPSGNQQPFGSLPWDVLRTRTADTSAMQLTLDDLAKGSGRDVMFCPSALKFDNDELYSTYTYATIDYILLVGAASKGPPAVLDLHYSDRIRTEYSTTGLNGEGTIKVPPSRRELVVDALAVSGTTWAWATQNLKKRSNHISGAVADGVNIGFVDGHVAWRSVAQMQAMSGSVIPKGRTLQVQGAKFVW